MNVTLYALLSDAYGDHGDDTEANRMITAALSIDPENTRALLTSVRRADDIDTAARRWARVPEDACGRMNAYFNYAIHLQGRVLIDFVERSPGLPEADRTLLLSEALVEARDMEELERFLTPRRVLAAYRELRDGGHRPAFRQTWGMTMALIVGHQYGLDLADRWVQTVEEAGPNSERARLLAKLFRNLRSAGLDEVPRELLYKAIPAER